MPVEHAGQYPYQDLNLETFAFVTRHSAQLSYRGVGGGGGNRTPCAAWASGLQPGGAPLPRLHRMGPAVGGRPDPVLALAACEATVTSIGKCLLRCVDVKDPHRPERK